MEALFIVHWLFVIHVYWDQPTYWRDQEGKWSVDSILWVFPGGVFKQYYNRPPVQEAPRKKEPLIFPNVGWTLVGSCTRFALNPLLQKYHIPRGPTGPSLTSFVEKLTLIPADGTRMERSEAASYQQHFFGSLENTKSEKKKKKQWLIILQTPVSLQKRQRHKNIYNIWFKQLFPSRTPRSKKFKTQVKTNGARPEHPRVFLQNP